MNALVVDSTQWIELPGAPEALEVRIGPSVLLEMLRDYFAVAQQSAAGLVRVRWRGKRPRFTAWWPAFTLIDLGAPAYESSPDRCAINLDVLGGWLVDPASTPCLTIAVTRHANTLVASVELHDYAPRGVRWAAVRWLYLHSQVPIHAHVGLTYLRLLKQGWIAPICV